MILVGNKDGWGIEWGFERIITLSLQGKNKGHIGLLFDLVVSKQE